MSYYVIIIIILIIILLYASHMITKIKETILKLLNERTDFIQRLQVYEKETNKKDSDIYDLNVKIKIIKDSHAKEMNCKCAAIRSLKISKDRRKRRCIWN